MLDSGEGAGPEGWRIRPFGETGGSSLFKGSQGVWRQVCFGLWPEQESLGTGLVAGLRMPGHWDHKTVLSWGGAPGPEGGKTESCPLGLPPGRPWAQAHGLPPLPLLPQTS